MSFLQWQIKENKFLMKHQKTIEQNVIKYIKRHNLLFGAKKILIALSGGADSVFALHFFYKYKKKYNLDIIAAHINHNLRGSESDQDEEFCRKICKNFNISFFTSGVDVKKFAKTNKLSIEESARILRYQKLEQIAENTKSDVIVTAHNINDNTETVLLNIVSGAGIDGISGIPIKRGNIIRPFLCISKEEIKNYLNNLKIKYREDSSNKNIEYKRNYLRNKIIPLIKNEMNPSLDKVILSSTEVIKNQKKVLDYFISTIINEVVSQNKTNVVIKTSKLKNYPESVLGEIFKFIFQKIINIEYSFNNFVELKELIYSQTGTKINLSKGYAAIRERGRIVISKFGNKKIDTINIAIGETIKLGEKRIIVKKLKNIPQRINEKDNTEIISADKINEKLTIRKWKAGDKIQPLGMKGNKKISDILTDLKIPSSERANKLVLLNGNDIVWLIGLKISEKYKITSKTKSVIKLCLK